MAIDCNHFSEFQLKSYNIYCSVVVKLILQCSEPNKRPMPNWTIYIIGILQKQLFFLFQSAMGKTGKRMHC